jgi:hypothetical protein
LIDDEKPASLQGSAFFIAERRSPEYHKPESGTGNSNKMLSSPAPLTDCAKVAILPLLSLKVTPQAPLLSRVPLTDCIVPPKNVP